ncbi:hypothetical protein PG985_008147 [Apiospora marii]|uniref:CN hydrolase domain-containing protein n=1 Tax=Apiospora marii TaxID=335849 RepID=A0ABR1R9J4_9PEZI
MPHLPEQRRTSLSKDAHYIPFMNCVGVFVFNAKGVAVVGNDVGEKTLEFDRRGSERMAESQYRHPEFEFLSGIQELALRRAK